MGRSVLCTTPPGGFPIPPGRCAAGPPSPAGGEGNADLPGDRGGGGLLPRPSPWPSPLRGEGKALLSGWEPLGAGFFVCRDFGFVAFDQRDLVQAFQEELARERVDLEAIAEAFASHLLRLQVDDDFRF